MEPNICMMGGLLEGGLAAFGVPFPSFLMGVTNLIHLYIMW